MTLRHSLHFRILVLSEAHSINERGLLAALTGGGEHARAIGELQKLK
jgi:hypothetical protein